MDLATAHRGVSAWRKVAHDWKYDRAGDRMRRKALTETSFPAKRGTAIDRYYVMAGPEHTEIYDTKVYDQCRSLVGLWNMGFTNFEADERLGWSRGTAGALEYQHPRLIERAKQVALETAYRRFHQAKVRELEVIASTVMPSIILLAQVVHGGAEYTPEEYRSRLEKPVAGSEVSLSSRLSAATKSLAYANERIKMAMKDEDSPLDDLPQLPKDFTDRMKEADDIALKLVPLAKEVAGK